MRLSAALAAAALLLAQTAAAWAAESFTFDVSEFEKKPFELGGYVELRQERSQLNQDGAIYRLNFYSNPHSHLDETIVNLKPSGKLRHGDASLNFRANLEGNWGTLGSESHFRWDEFYGSYKPNPGLTVDAG